MGREVKTWERIAFVVILAAIAVYFAGCSSQPESCVTRQYKEIKLAWRHYEWVRRVEVRFPDWRRQAHQWARIECDFGQPVRSFRP